MDVPLSEIIDRISILMLKIENRDLPAFHEELKECNQEVEKMKEKGILVKEEWLDDLYKINKYQWDLESKNKEGQEGKLSLEELGRVYIELQISNKRRVAVKNRIVEDSKNGFTDIKIN